LVLGAFDAVSPGLRQTLRRWAETLDNRWNVWVLSYGKDQQKQWLEQWGWGKVDAVSLLRLIVLIAATVGLLGALWAWRESRRQAPWQRLTQKILAELQGAGVAATAAQDPHTWALALRGKHGAAAQAATQALLDLHAQRYAPKNAQERGQNTTAWWRGFRQAMRSIPKPR
jgi:hypothetical protein